MAVLISSMVVSAGAGVAVAASLATYAQRNWIRRNAALAEA